MADWAAAGRLSAAGRTLDYRCHGPAPDGAPTLVLLHEGLGSAGLWRDVPEKLAEATGLGVMAYSRAGYGGSDPAELPRPLDYMTTEAVAVLPEVLEALGIGECILVGHSDGATIAAIHAGRVQDMRVRGIVLMAPHFFTEAMGLASIAAAREAYLTGDLRTRLARHHPRVDDTFNGWAGAWLSPLFRDWNVADVLDTIRVPILAIQGRQDQYGTLSQIDEVTRRASGPVETLILDDCRHAPFADHPEIVLPAIAGFAARCLR